MSVRIAWESEGSGDPVLLVQGLGYARWGWEPLATRLAKDFQVVSFDNRGIGESEIPPGPYTVAELAEDAVGVLAAAGVDRAHVVGASLGGMTAQQLAIAHPERVRKLVLLCTTPGGPDAYPLPEGTVKLFAEAPSLAPEEALRKFVENSMVARDAVVEEVYARRLANPPDMKGWQAQVAASTAWDADGGLARIESPTLVLHGTEDNVVDCRNAELLGAQIPGAEVRLVAGVGHLLWWERPDEVAAAIREFLA